MIYRFKQVYTMLFPKIKEEELPTELQGKSKDEIKQLVTQKEKERNDIYEMPNLRKKWGRSGYIL